MKNTAPFTKRFSVKFYILLITLCNWKFWLESDGLYSIIQHSVLRPYCAALIISHVFFSHRKENWNFPLMYSWSMKFGDQCSPYILCIKEKVLIKFILQQQDNTDIKNRLWFQYKSWITNIVILTVIYLMHISSIKLYLPRYNLRA